MEYITPGQENSKKEEAAPIPTIFERLSVLMNEQTRDMDGKISELSQANEGDAGSGPTIAELAAAHEGIKAQIEALGEANTDLN